ncbi:MAG: DEAD/DEAH box helicase [Clostridium sp.]
MSNVVKLMPHQERSIAATKDHNRCAYYLDMGLGKTFVGSEKMKALNTAVNLIVCQKSKIQDWCEHFKTFYPQYNTLIYSKSMEKIPTDNVVIIINYDLIWRRPEFLQLENFTLMLDESSCIKNTTAERTKFILKLKPSNVILLSGTPTGGKYEELYSQCKLLGWKISKKAFWESYIVTRKMDINGFSVPIVIGYKNIDRLKAKLREYGAVFMKTEEVLDLPEQIDNVVKVPITKEYKKFAKNRVIEIENKELVGDTSLTKMLYLRQLASQYNTNKTTMLRDLLESTNDRVIIFYNFTDELEKIEDMCIRMERPVSVVNGQRNDLKCYEKDDDSVTLIQYQAGAMGLNLQKSNKIIYFSLPLSSELFEQSKKRTHRIGQKNTCLYYYLITEDSIEEKIYEVLGTRRDFTNKLFEEIDPEIEVIKEEPKEEKITPAKLIPEQGITIYIGDDKYYGSGHFLLREDVCKNDLKKRVEKLLLREVGKDSFKDLKERIYSNSEKEMLEHEITDGTPYITLKDGDFETNIQPKYYKYFKNLGLEFRFINSIEPVGLFKDGIWVGLVLPVRVTKPTLKFNSPSKESEFEIPEDEIPF